MRKPERSPAPITPAAPLYSVTNTYKLLTPLFGGGTRAGYNDLSWLIRPASIRGHLRFWWRATQAGRFCTLAELRAAEATLWGAVSSSDNALAAPVQVIVSDIRAGQAWDGDNNIPIGHYKSRYSYVAFPLEGSVTLQRDVAFTLTLQIIVPDAAEQRTELQQRIGEIEATLWAWETFGGIGARTRRGFGALVRSNAAEIRNVNQWLVAHLQRYVAEPCAEQDADLRRVPRLSRDLNWYQTTAPREPWECWKYVFGKLKQFRQQRPTNGNRPGRNRWPEPDAIRQITGQRLPTHANPLSNVDKFPRAAFGLPIIFQFKDGRKGNYTDPNLDPGPMTLKGEGKIDRLASPLILRPLQVGPNRAVGLAAVLETPRTPPGGLRLEGGPHLRTVEHQLTRAEATGLTDCHGAPLLGTTDILAAFLQYLQEE